jgi:hypothetical protein
MTRKDNMTRHCKEAHGKYCMFLRKGKAPVEPYCLDWYRKVMYPKDIIVEDEDYEEDSASDGNEEDYNQEVSISEDPTEEKEEVPEEAESEEEEVH